MYEAFYNLREKPFTLLPDPGFLFLSDKHRMALTLLEYGLMNQAGFTVISGDIGTGKTTLIRHLLDNMDRDHTVGLISNTHRDFGELLQWILLAFNLEHANLNKVEMYQRFIDFIIDEYAHNRRTVLIVDEAQNMAAETLEELRMLSNINADKDQALQVILVGQRELRDTLRRPDLVQFAQRISVDYHLQPLSEDEVVGYIRHRVEVAGGNPDLFDIAACQAVHRFSGGVPRLINLLCDTALVYGYAQEKQQIDNTLINDVAREKQQGGIFPTYAEPEPQPGVADTAPVEPEYSAAAEAVEPVHDTEYASPGADPVDLQSSTPVIEGNHNTIERHDGQTPPDNILSETTAVDAKKKVRLAIASTRVTLCHYLSRLLESYGFDVVSSGPLDEQFLGSLQLNPHDILLIDCNEDTEFPSGQLENMLVNWREPVLINDSIATEISLQHGDPEFGNRLAERINLLLGEQVTASTSSRHY